MFLIGLARLPVGLLAAIVGQWVYMRLVWWWLGRTQARKSATMSA